MKFNYQEFILDNGLRLIVHEDHSIPIAAVNILYNVGSKDESPEKTGFAHLFEHLMFGGSKNIPSFDEPLQKVGGENNAYTSPDLTNYYLTLPSNNLETAFWLESDRMLSLSFEEKILNVQRNVVIEEFKQRYLNQPYGDIWLKIRPLAYKTHPYRWPTIGREISHIENATMQDVRAFFNTFYLPNNAIMTVAGDVKPVEVLKLAKKWFEPIPSGNPYVRRLPAEKPQKEKRILETEADVPSNAIYMVWHMGGRLDPEYHATDLLSDITGRGKASRLYQNLVREKNIFHSINAFIMGSVDPGLFVISGKLKDRFTLPEAESAVLEVLEDIKSGNIKEEELNSVKTQAETSQAFSEVEIISRAMSLSYFSNLGNTDLYFREKEKIKQVSVDNIISASRKILQEKNMSVLYYNSFSK